MVLYTALMNGEDQFANICLKDFLVLLSPRTPRLLKPLELTASMPLHLVSSSQQNISRLPLTVASNLECLRDIGLEDEALRLAMRGPPFCSMRFSRNFVGEEYGRIAAWEEDPIVSVSIAWCSKLSQH